MPRSDPLLTSRFRFQAPALLAPRARLYEERLELTGWRLFRRYRRRVPLGHVLCADAEGERLVLWLDSGGVIRLEMPEAQRWKAAIDAEQALRRDQQSGGGGPAR